MPMVLKSIAKPVLDTLAQPMRLIARTVTHALYKAHRDLAKVFHNKTREIVDCGMQVRCGPLHLSRRFGADTTHQTNMDVVHDASRMSSPVSRGM